MERLLALVDDKKVQAVMVAKLDRLTRSVKGSMCVAGHRGPAGAEHHDGSQPSCARVRAVSAAGSRYLPASRNGLAQNNPHVLQDAPIRASEGNNQHEKQTCSYDSNLRSWIRRSRERSGAKHRKPGRHGEYRGLHQLTLFHGHQRFRGDWHWHRDGILAVRERANVRWHPADQRDPDAYWENGVHTHHASERGSRSGQ